MAPCPDRLIGKEDHVFATTEGSYLEDSALRRRYYAAPKAAGIRHLRFHDLGHTFGTLAVQCYRPQMSRSTWAVPTSPPR